MAESRAGAAHAPWGGRGALLPRLLAAAEAWLCGRGGRLGLIGGAPCLLLCVAGLAALYVYVFVSSDSSHVTPRDAEQQPEAALRPPGAAASAGAACTLNYYTFIAGVCSHASRPTM